MMKCRGDPGFPQVNATWIMITEISGPEPIGPGRVGIVQPSHAWQDAQDQLHFKRLGTDETVAGKTCFVLVFF